MNESYRLLAALLAAFTLASPLHAGLMFTSVTSGESDKGGETVSMTVKASVDGAQARVEFTESRNPVMKQGQFMLTQDGGQTLYLINPEDKSYMKWDMQGMMASAGQAMQAMKGMVKLKFSSPKVEKLLNEKGAPILGYPTRHYQYRTTYTTEMSIFGMKNTSTTVLDEDLWTTSKLTDPGCGVWLKRDPPKTGDAQLDDLIMNGMDKIEGFPLKRVTVTTTTDGKGKTNTGRAKMEVTAIEKKSFPTGTFVLPAGYTEMSMVPDGTRNAAGEDVNDDTNAPAANPFLKLLKQRISR